MSSIKRYLKQTVAYQGEGGRDPFTGEPVPGEPINIRARYEEKQRYVRGAQGSEVTSTAEVLMEIEPTLNGKIEGRPIQARESLVNRQGKVIGWRAFL
ncbi:MAG: hypothetical protein M3Q49_22450 [Actinomycetota bacterium]|jgi:hypothetical protein|nr:hypothetical protein [Actinomycetota bacterium]